MLCWPPLHTSKCWHCRQHVSDRALWWRSGKSIHLDLIILKFWCWCEKNCITGDKSDEWAQEDIHSPVDYRKIENNFILQTPVIRHITCVGAGYVGGPTCAMIASKVSQMGMTIDWWGHGRSRSTIVDDNSLCRNSLIISARHEMLSSFDTPFLALTCERACRKLRVMSYEIIAKLTNDYRFAVPAHLRHRRRHEQGANRCLELGVSANLWGEQL